MDISVFFTKTNDSICVTFDYEKHIEIRIQKKDIIWTKGYEIYLNTLKIRSLCRLHLNNNCNYKNNCMQIHITYDCINKLKKLMKNNNLYNNCCEIHGDLHTIYNDKITNKIIINELNIIIPNKYIAKTVYFENTNPDFENIVISTNDICRAHQQNKCNYFFECKYVHICRQYYDETIKNICNFRHNKINNEMYDECIEIYKLEKYKKIFGLKYICGVLKNELNHDNCDDEIFNNTNLSLNFEDNLFFEKFNIIH